MRDRRLIAGLILPVVAALGLCIAAFWPGLSGGFILDDFNNIVVNERIHLTSLDAQSIKQAMHAYGKSDEVGRPLASLSFALNHYAGGLNPFGYKLTNLVLHLGNTVLVGLLAWTLLGASHPGLRWRQWACFSVAVVWAIHPIQVSTVLYVVQRMEMLATTFVLVALLLYWRGRQAQIAGKPGWPALAASAAVAAFGLLSKESAILFPVFALGLELCFLHFAANNRRVSRILRGTYIAGTVTALLVFIFWAIPHFTSDAYYQVRDFTVAERLLTQLRVLPLYLSQIVLPAPGSLLFFYDAYPKSTGLFQPITTFAGGLLLIVLVAAACWNRKRAPLFSLGIFWFFGAHALTSNIISLELVFEHRNYFALVGVLLALADLAIRLPMADGPRLKMFGVAVLVVGCTGLALLRSATWGNEHLLAIDLVAKNPQSPRAASDLATIYAELANGDPDSRYYPLSIGEFERASRLPGSSPLPEQGLILVAATAGQEVQQAWWDSLVEKVRTRPIGPQEILAVTGLMNQHYEGVPLDKARVFEAYAALLDRKSWPGYMYARLGAFVLDTDGSDAMATTLFLRAVEADPGNRDYAEALLARLVMDGHGEQAAAIAERLGSSGLPQGAGND